MGRHSSGSDRPDGRDGAADSGRIKANAAASPRPSADDDFGFDHRTVRSGRRISWWWALAALVVVAALVTGVIIWRASSGNSCDSRTTVAVASDGAMTGVLRDVAGEASAGSCYDYDVQTASGADVPGLLTQGDKAPDLWLADSQVQARRVTTQVRRDLDLVAPSIATSPTVVAGQKIPALTNWVEVLKLGNLRAGSPIDTSTGDASIIGALAEVDSGALAQRELTDAMTVAAVQQNNARLANDTEGARLSLANTYPDIPVVTTEQQLLLFKRTHPGSALTASIPADGTVMLDYPLVNTASTARRGEAADAGKVLVAALAGDAGRKALSNAGYRQPDGSDGPEGGLGDSVKILTLRDPSAVDRALRQWQVLGVPVRTLVVEDTSGSMETPVDGTTRAGLLVDASLIGLKLFPNNTMIGGWAFGIDKGGPGQDWTELSPIRRLDAPVASGGTHREELARAVEQGLSVLGGGTGLYDTTLAAFKHVQDTYDPNYSNSVIMMTDGKNEDPGSISLSTLLAELKKLEDPARPVLVLTIGISDDADTAALKQIADATGGTTYVAKTADDIKTVFVDAIAARVEAAGR